MVLPIICNFTLYRLNETKSKAFFYIVGLPNVMKTFILTVYTYSVVRSKIWYSDLKTTLRGKIIHFNVLKTHGETTGKCIILPPHKLL